MNLVFDDKVATFDVDSVEQYLEELNNDPLATFNKYVANNPLAIVKPYEIEDLEEDEDQ